MEKHRGTVAFNSVHLHPRTPACTTVISIYAGLCTDPNRNDRLPKNALAKSRYYPHGQQAQVEV